MKRQRAMHSVLLRTMLVHGSPQGVKSDFRWMKDDWRFVCISVHFCGGVKWTFSAEDRNERDNLMKCMKELIGGKWLNGGFEDGAEDR